MKMVETEAILRELMIASQAGSASEYRRLLEALKIRLDIFFAAGLPTRRRPRIWSRRR